MEAWQKLVTDAYKTWSQDKSYEDFLDGLDQLSRDAVLLGNMNSQVQNGGFHQWVENGYATHIHEVVEALEKLEGSAPLRVKKMLEKVEPYLNDCRENRGCMGNYLNLPSWGSEGSDEEYDAMTSEFNELDTDYYSFSKEFEEVVAGYFQSHS